MTTKPIGQVDSALEHALNWKSGLRIFATMAIAVVGMASSVYASPITIPIGLASGATYRLVFVTDETYAAADTIIGDYNTEVSNEADTIAALAALGTTWSVMGSTSSVNAIDNIGQDAGVAIYNLDGQEVASDATTSSGGLFSGNLVNAINYDENGNVLNAAVWTGTGPTGVASVYPFGDVAFYAYDTTWGCSQTACASSENWTQFSDSPDSTDYSLYAISGVLTVPSSSTPEPATTGMVTIGVVFLYLAARRRRRTGSATPTRC